MALDRTRKSVIFHKGISDDADRFLLEPPAIDYAENLRIDKEGSLQKRPGFGPSALTTVQDANGDPFILHAIGDALHTLTEDGARSYENGVWSNIDATGFIGTKRMEVETPPIGGMGHVDMFPFYDGTGQLSRYLVAYEVRERSSSNTSFGTWEERPKHVVIQEYTSDGRFVTQKRVPGARSPKITAHPNSVIPLPVLWYQRESDETLMVSVIWPGVSLTGTPVNTGIQPSPTFGMGSVGGSSILGRPMWSTRLGASADGHARYHVAIDTDNDTALILYQKDSSVTLERLSSTFVSQALNPLATASSFITYEALDIVYQSGGFAHVLFASYKSDISRSSFVLMESVKTTGSMPQEWFRILLLDTGTQSDPLYFARTYNHGGLSMSEDESQVVWMVHTAGEGVAGNHRSVRDRNTGTHYGVRYAESGDPIGDSSTLFPHHRLASRPFWYDGKIYAAVQQWHDCTLYTDDVAAYDDWAAVDGALVPRTTVIACFDRDAGVVRPVAYVDAGQSKTSEYTESELHTHVPRAYVDNGQILFLNRVAIHAEDISLTLGPSDAEPVTVRLGSSESPSDAMCRIHRIGKGGSSVARVYGSKMGDGLMLSTAIPLWFDGKFFGEVGTLDQPEIIDVRDARIEEDVTKVRPLINFDGIDKGGDDEWRKFNVITGYYDSRGNKHRSAPSTTVYVNGLNGVTPNEDGDPLLWQGKEVTIYFTLPLSVLPDDLEYFVEAYASDNIDDDPVFIGSNTIPLDSVLSPDDISVTVQLVRWMKKNGGDSFGMPPRISRGLYTSGGVLAADPWPAFTHSVATSTRLWVLDAVNKGRVIPSKLFEDFISPEYNSTLTIRLGDERNLTAIGKLDDKVIVFEPNDVHVIYGEGPDNRGQGQDFAVHYVTTDVGCEDQESVIETPAGLIFYSKPRGFYLLDRNLQIQFIGGGIEDLAKDIDVVTATLAPDRAEVRFVFTGGPLLNEKWGPVPDFHGVLRPPAPVFTNTVPLISSTALSYNYERGTWMLFTNYDAAAATIYQNKYTMLLNNWDIWQESDTRFDDPTGLNLSVMTTPWIKLSEQVQSFARLWKMTFLGRYMSSLQDLGGPPFPLGSGPAYEAGDVEVKVYYDYESTSSQTKLFPFQDFGYDPFNSPPKRAERFQFEIEPSRGRCQAVKIQITEKLSTDRGEGGGNGVAYKQGHGFEIVSIDFDMGVSPMRSLLPQKSKK